jgi:dimethylargininase
LEADAMRLAMTREVSPAIARCQLTHLPRQAIDVAAAREQHDAYEQALEAAGCSVRRLAADGTMPDSVFVEDAAVVFDEVAVIMRPGAESRRIETPAVSDALRPYRPIRTIEAPGTIDGGDVLAVERHVFVGQTSRTNRAALSQMEAILVPFGYAIHPIEVRGCLHLKSAVTAVSPDALLINRSLVSADPFCAFDLIDVDPAEPLGANALAIGGRVIYPAAFARTRGRLERRGLQVSAVDVSELAKAEGAVTCCSIIVRP